MDGILRWEDPPPPVDASTVERRPWALVAAQLRQRPGCWALIDDSATNTSVAARITAGRGWWKPRGAFESRMRAIDGRMRVYARYVGGGSRG